MALAEGEREAQKREAVALAERKVAQKRFTWAAIVGFVVAMGFAAATAWQFSDARAQRQLALQEGDTAKKAMNDAQTSAKLAQDNDVQAKANLRDALKAREDAETAKKDAIEARDRMHVIESQVSRYTRRSEETERRYDDGRAARARRLAFARDRATLHARA